MLPSAKPRARNDLVMTTVPFTGDGKVWRKYDDDANANDCNSVPVLIERTDEDAPIDTTAPNKRGVRFWAAFAALIATATLSALDATIIFTSLPTISTDLDLGPDYLWVANVYPLTAAIIQPPLGQICDLWGRRWTFIAFTAIFTIGSGLCGGAVSGPMLIAGRAVQGLGSGGVLMIGDLVVCDLVPLRERGRFLGIKFCFIGVFTSVGPLIGGALAESGNWRWSFLLSVPVGCAAILLSVVCLRVKTPARGTFTESMALIDWGGITIVTAASVTIMYALTYGGTVYTWSDSAVLTPLVAGFLLLVIFALYEGTPFPRSPLAPYRIFSNRQTALAIFITFITSTLTLNKSYVYALYFQSVLGVSQTLAGVYMLPSTVVTLITSAAGGSFLGKWGRFKPIHVGGFAAATLGAGLSSLLRPDSSAAEWIVYQIFIAGGLGITMACLLPAVQATLEEKDAALSTSAASFARCFGLIWSTTVPQAVFNNRIDQVLYMVHDERARQLLGGGHAYARASGGSFVASFEDEATRAEIVQVYTVSLQQVWQVTVIFSIAALLASLFEREVTLRKNLHTEFGLEKGRSRRRTSPRHNSKMAQNFPSSGTALER